MSAIVKADASAVVTSAQMLDVALRTAGALKNARGLLPESLKSEGEIVAVLLAGQELGLMPMAALRGLQVVRGKVIISYDTMVALLRRAGYRIEWLHGDATKATLKLTAPDNSTHVETWDEARAKKAGLWGKGTWAQYPDTMLRARCVSSAARAFAGDVLAGVYVEGEIPTTVAEVAPLRAEVIRNEPPATEAPPRKTIETEDGEIVEVPNTFAECRDPEDLRRFCADKREALSVLVNGQRKTAIAKATEIAERLHCDVAEVLWWCGLGAEP
jgi:hypothetical protein